MTPLCSSLLDMFRSESSTFSELIDSFDDIYRATDRKPSYHYFQLLMCAAAKHSHTDLVAHLLDDPRCHMKTSLDGLFIAIRTNNLKLVDIILRSRFRLRLLKKNVPLSERLKGNDDIPLTYLSGIEYACICDHRDVLKMLVANYDLNQERYHFNVVKRELRDECLRRMCRCHDIRSTALHAVVTLVRNDSFRKMLTLPAIIQLILDTGVDVNGQKVRHKIALSLLIEEVKTLGIRLVDDTIEVHAMIVDAVHVLLTAGSISTGQVSKLFIESPLYILLDLTPTYLFICFSDINFVDKYSNLGRMIVALIKLLLQHGALQIPRHWKIILIKKILDVSCDCIALRDNDHTRMLSNSVNVMADIFNYFLLSDPDLVNDFYASGTLFRGPGQRYNYVFDLRETFEITFVNIAGYSTDSDDSNRYVHLLLSYMSASKIQQLGKRLSGPISQTDAHGDSENKRKALEFLSAVEVPFILQHLSRRAITRALSYRCLSTENMATLNVLKCVEEYVLQYVN